MRELFVPFLIPFCLLAACSSEPSENSAIEMVETADYGDAEPVNEFGFWEAESTGPSLDLYGEGDRSAENETRAAVRRARSTNAAASETKEEQAQPNSNTNIAYSYDYGFSIEQENIPELQKRHVDICESLGDKCRILRLSQAGTDGFDGYGELRLQVAAPDARKFGDSLSSPAEELGGERVSFVVAGEDLGEILIDTEAKLQSRLVLREKLTAILRSNRGSVDELVKAETAVAKVNEEIDANRSKLAELGNRIRFSSISIQYSPYLGRTNNGFIRPVTVAFQEIGTTLGATIAALIYLVTALVPITIFLLVVRWLWRKSGIRIRRKTATDE